MTPTERIAAVMQAAGTTRIADLIDQLNPDQQAIQILERVAGEAFAAGWRADPFTMARHIDAGQVHDWRSSRLLASKFREAVDGTNRFQTWNAPTQTVGKSTWLRYGMLWAFDKRPSGSMLYLCHSASLAREGALFVRDRARAHRAELRFDLSPDLQQQGHWKTTQGGQLVATYVGGGAGHPATLGVVIDDPLKNWQEAHSASRRDNVWSEILTVARMRLAPKAFMIMAHTRLHLDDPTGRMRQLEAETGQRFDHVILPMIAKENDQIGRAPGEPLEMHTVEEAEARREFVGEYLAKAMEDQDPIPDVGGELRREWWRHTDTPPRRGDIAATSWDMKLKEKATGDYVVGLAGVRIGGDFFILDQLRGQWSLLQTKVAIALMAVRYPWIQRHVVENTGNGPEVMEQLRRGDETFTMTDALRGEVHMAEIEADAVQDLLRRGMSGLIAENPTHSKVVRARTYTPRLETGNVWLPTNAGWTAGFIDEAATFPPKAGGHDDRVDAWSQLMKHLDRNPGRVFLPTEPTPPGNPEGAANAIPAAVGPAQGSTRGNARVYR